MEVQKMNFTIITGPQQLAARFRLNLIR